VIGRADSARSVPLRISALWDVGLRVRRWCFRLCSDRRGVGLLIAVRLDGLFVGYWLRLRTSVPAYVWFARLSPSAAEVMEAEVRVAG